MSTATLIREIEAAHLQPKELLRFLEENPNGRELNHYPILGQQSIEDRAVLHEAAFVADQLKIHPADFAKLCGIVPDVRGASFLTGTSVELLYASITTGTALATFTTEDNVMKTLPALIIPAGFFYNLGAAGKSLKLRGYYRCGTTATPTMTFSVRLRTNRTWAADGVVISSAAITMGSGVTLAPVQLDFDIICRAIVDGATGLTLAMMGMLTGGTAFAVGGGSYSMPPANTAFTVTLDNTVTQYIYLSVACGTSNGSNLVQLEMLKAYGEN